jgi:hypothetical protein
MPRYDIHSEVWLSGYADASFGDGKGTWAIWVRDNTQRILKTGICPSWVQSLVQAKLYAVSMAITTAVKELDSSSASALTIKVPSQAVCQYFKWFGRKLQCPEAVAVVRMSQELATNAGVKLLIAKTPGEKNLSNPQSYGNMRIDHMIAESVRAGKEMRWACPIHGVGSFERFPE